MYDSFNDFLSLAPIALYLLHKDHPVYSVHPDSEEDYMKKTFLIKIDIVSIQRMNVTY